MVDMRAFGNLISGVNQPGAGYRPGIDPEHAYYNYAALPATVPRDATGGASQPMVPRQMTSSRERGRGGEQREPGYDPNQGAGTSDLSLWEGIKKFGPYALAVAGGSAGMGMLAAKKGIRALRDKYDYETGGGGGTASAGREETFAGAAMNQYERDYGGDRGSTMGDIGGSRVDNTGPSGARDDIGTREGRYHQGGPITDQDPSTYRENMEITAQEGEVVMTREAVAMLGVDFFEQINQAAKQVGRPNQAPTPAAQPPAATGLPAFALMAGGAPV